MDKSVQTSSLNLFVPGRICLFGEHSDWAGGYRRINSAVEKGYTIICGTNQGLYAKVYPHENELVYHSTMPDGEKKTFRCPMNIEELLNIAEKGEHWSYIAGVAYQVLTHYHVKGIEIDNYKTDLPVKKGLSSSAAVCVLTARAFNRMYDLKMTVRGEMEMAYRGEITTPSRCGRMDQGCAYGNKPVLMTYDGDMLHVRELSVAGDLFFVIVDLHAKKDTIKILKELNDAYPFADDPVQEKVQEYLGPVNKEIVFRALEHIKNGEADKVGALMTEAQEKFDKHLMPACPDELTAPVLHGTLLHQAVRPYVYGGKGVGSQGDGTAQFICKDEDAQKSLVTVLTSELKMEALALTLYKTKKIKKAVITAAGFGTRLFPMTKIIRKEFMPVIDKNGQMKPLIIQNIEEAVSAGVEEICLIIQEEERPFFEKLLHEPVPQEVYNKLNNQNREYARYVEEIGGRVSFIHQPEQKGLGHAVLTAKDFVGEGPFLLILGDHFFASRRNVRCASQLVDEYDRANGPLIGLAETKESELYRFGTVSGVWEDDGKLLSVTEFYEKPSVEYAKEHLQVENLPEGEYLTAFGQYVLPASLFSELENMIAEDSFEKGELQLTTAVERIRKREGLRGFCIDGKRIDIGTPAGYSGCLSGTL